MRSRDIALQNWNVEGVDGSLSDSKFEAWDLRRERLT